MTQQDDNNFIPAIAGKKAVSASPSSLTYARQLTRSDAALLARSVELEETDPPFALKGLARLTLFLIVLFILWASLTPFAEVAKTPGVILPSDRVQQVQPAASGPVSQIFVRDGDRVQKGQLLMTLDNQIERAEREQLALKLATLKVNLETISALDQERTPDFTALSLSDKNLITRASSRFTSTKDQRLAQLALLDAAIRSAAAEIDGSKGQMDALAVQVAALQEAVDQREELLRLGTGSRLAFQEARQRHAQANSELEEVKAKLARAESAQLEARARKAEAVTSLKNADQQNINQLILDMQDTEEALKAAEQRLANRSIASPVNGQVSGLTITRSGRVVQTGEELLTIVPDSNTLIAEVKVAPKDIGFVDNGQSVLVRIDGYRFGRVGGIGGTVERVSADPITDENGNSYFTAWISLEKNYVGEDPGANRIISGMTVAADIHIGEKTLMAYLIRPVHNSLKGAFSER